jgi:hypothetical protein
VPQLLPNDRSVPPLVQVGLVALLEGGEHLPSLEWPSALDDLGPGEQALQVEHVSGLVEHHAHLIDAVDERNDRSLDNSWVMACSPGVSAPRPSRTGLDRATPQPREIRARQNPPGPSATSQLSALQPLSAVRSSP